MVRGMALSRPVRRVLLGLFAVAFVGGAIYLWRSGSVTPTPVKDCHQSPSPAAPAFFIAPYDVS